MKKTLTLLSLVAMALAQTGCMSSPVAAASSPFSAAEWSVIGLGTAASAAIGNSMDSSIGGPIGAAVGLAGTAAVLQSQDQKNAQIVAEAKEEARREERAIVMRDYWNAAQGSDSVGLGSGYERDVRYDAGVYDGISYENRALTRQFYLQEATR
jgi:hypothetical protein